MLARFDVVGIDPRGTNFSDEVACFPGNAQQGKVLSGLNVAFPFTKAEEQAAVSSSKGLGKACSTTGKPLSAAMSTAEVARDMDVIRRGVGDKRLSYLGFSYGSYLGQVYANLFPDRVRAVAIDGVLDPVAWAGTKATASQPQGDRIRSADGATKALHQILVLCDKAGGQKCRFSPGNPVVNYDVVAGRLKAKPLVFTDPYTGELVTFTYADLVSGTLGSLYGPYGYLEITGNLADLIILTEPPAKASSAAARARRATAVRSFAREPRRAEEAGRQPPRLELPVRQLLRGLRGSAVHRRAEPRRTRQRGRRSPPRPTAGPSTSGGCGPGSRRRARAARGRPGTRTATAVPSPVARSLRCWSSARGGTPPRTTTGPSPPHACCPTAGCCRTTTGDTRRTGRRSA